MRKVSTCLVLALVGGALLAGCGSGSKSTSNSASSSTATVTTGSPSSGVSGTKGSSAAGSTHPLTPKQIVEDCKRIVGAPSALTAAQKEKLLKSCEKAGGSSAAQHEIIHEVCAALASHLTAGPARQRALAICRSTR